MGTTITTNYGLIKPDADESIREDLPTFDGWASQNADNCDTIDGIFRMSTATYSATWTASGTNPTLGSGGFVQGKYVRYLPRMVVVYFRIFCGGSGFSPGSGIYKISLPFAMDASLKLISNELPVGRASFLDDSAVATSSCFTVCYSSVSDVLFCKLPINDSWTSSNPVTLAQNDRINGYAIYPTSDA